MADTHMNAYDSTHDEPQSRSQQAQQGSRWTMTLERRISEVSLTDFCHFCLMLLLVVATAKAVFNNEDTQHEELQNQAGSAQPALTIAQIRAEAGMRIAEGASADEVVAWMDQAIVSAGQLEEVPVLETFRARQVAMTSSRQLPTTSRRN